jgi:FKBP-type peptidyl-prolyl cis-trans isomerase
MDGRYETPKEKYKVCVNDGSWLIFHTRRKGGKRVHIKNMKKDYRKCIRSYASFLRADGIDNVDEMLYYILHYTFWHISFNRMLKKISYDNTRPMIDEVIKWIMKKDIDKVDKSEFIDPRKTAAPNEIITKLGGIGKARKSEKIRVVRQAQRKLTDMEIAEKYNPDLTIKENAANIGIGLTRLKEWKKEYINSVESIEDKVKRLYDPSLSWKKNAKIIGHSVNTIKKYIMMEEKMEIDFITPELETADNENQFTERLDTYNDEILTENIKIISHSPNTTNEHIKKEFDTAELGAKKSDDQFDIDDDNELNSWVMEYEFEEDVEQKNENADSVESTEGKVKQEELIVGDTEATKSDTAVENMFEGRLDIDSDEFWRWMWGDEILEEVKREKEQNARLFGAEDVVKMVV